ncbi:MAG: DUF427 domain-containing protein [Proteobacteria bacterium]|nr:DUF427 domain-containing protein [Pseudomonadota bacterium]MDA1023712.1 DUF427 domain-containing protein [Pseudomonadota bacterium]
MAASPETKITFETEPKHLRVVFGGHIIADSKHVLVLLEPGHGDVLYFPRADVRMEFLKSTDHSTHCPYKGDASYWTIDAGGEIAENAVWGYEAAFDDVSEIKGYISFYPDRVEILGVV